MTTDYGMRIVPRGPPIGKIAIAAGLLILFGAVVAGWIWQRPEGVQDAREWTIAGPPCPPATSQAYGRLPFHVSRAFDFADVRFGRAFGHASCAEIHDDGGLGMGTHPVCQFTSPGVLQITTKRGVYYFVPQTGPATVSVPDGQPTCVLASKFKG